MSRRQRQSTTAALRLLTLATIALVPLNCGARSGRIEAGGSLEEAPSITHVQLSVHRLHDHGCTEGLLRILVDALHPYSALRDPVSKEVRVFFDAEPWLVADWEYCTFASDHWDWRDPANHVRVRGKLHGASDNRRRYDGFVMSCPDPGANYTRIVFPSDNWDPGSCGLKGMNIETIKVAKQPSVGACLVALFSERPIFEHWVENSLRVGIERIHAYYTLPHSKESASMFYGVHYNLGLRKPFVPFSHPSISYYWYEPPTHRFFFGQTTLLNDCIYRNRRQHTHLMISDSDEFVFVRKNAEKGLPALIKDKFPPKAASLVLDLLLFPADCLPNNETLRKYPERPFSQSITHFYKSAISVQPGKTIVAPTRVEIYMVHNVEQAVEGFSAGEHLNIRDAYVKHIRYNGQCEQFAADLVDERDSVVFEEVMHAYYAKWGGEV